MTEFKINTINTAPEESKEILEGAEKQLGFIPNLYGIMSEAPAALKAYNGLSTNFENSSFSPTEQQIILLTVSSVNECTYCVAVHSTVAQMHNVDQANIDAIRDSMKIPDNKLEALRKFTTAVIIKRGWVEKEEINAFLSAGYTKSQILEVIVGVAQKTLSNYINHIVHTPLDAAFEPNSWEKAGV